MPMWPLLHQIYEQHECGRLTSSKLICPGQCFPTPQLQRVEEVLEELGLLDCAETKIGNCECHH